MKKGILLIQLGSPKTTNISDVKSYLREFLTDPRVIDKQGIMWNLILNLFILPSRSVKSANEYKKIWQNDTFPLFKYTEEFTEKLKTIIEDENIHVEFSYILSEPRVHEKVVELHRMGCKKLLVIPLFPQYCDATTLSCKDSLKKGLDIIESKLEVEFITSYHDNKAYIESLVNQIELHLEGKVVDKLIFSFHGYPIRRIREGDPYLTQCIETANLIAERLNNILVDDMHITFQSKFGREPWLDPSTEETLIQFTKNGIENVAIVCPAFVVDNLETEAEVGIELKNIFTKGGGKNFYLIPCLNANDNWVEGFAQKVVVNNQENKLKLEKEVLQIEPQGCCHKKAQCENCPYHGLNEYPDGKISHKNSKVLKAVFITLFLDLIGFSIIFPLFPDLLEYYKNVENSQENGVFYSIYNIILHYTGETDSHATIALFGGVLTFLYSFLQFIMAPIFGVVSDRIGRRPIFIFTIGGIVISYILWIFSGSFMLLVISRFIGGLMAGNITTSTASVADVTSKKNRAKGMAYIGIAFGLGFTIGPVIGGLTAQVNLIDYFPNLVNYGINPFSIPALIALLLASYNFYYVYKYFPETLPKRLRGKGKINRTANPFRLFKIDKNPGVQKSIWGHFFFLISFASAETVLTFLTFERLGFSSTANGLLFLYIGLVIAGVQGGYVRRKAHDIGEVILTRRGLFLVIPAFILIALAGTYKSTALLYLSVGMMAVASSMIIPCFTALVSIYTPESEQGKNLGIFRSLGALARTIGPLLAGVLYWKYGFGAPYFVGSIMMILPIMLIMTLPVVKKD